MRKNKKLVYWTPEMTDNVSKVVADLQRQGIPMTVGGKENVSAVIRYLLASYTPKTTPTTEEKAE